VCNVFSLHRFFTDADTRADIDRRCRIADIGCVECKRILADNIAAAFAPFRERAAHYRAHPEEVRRILDEGAERARAIASATLAEVRHRMGLDWREALK
jgi:tryptophanyl-tRNA synthetase